MAHSTNSVSELLGLHKLHSPPTAWPLNHHGNDNDSGMGVTNQIPQNGASANDSLPKGPIGCFHCKAVFSDVDNCVTHQHADHGTRLSPCCFCWMCRAVFPEAEQFDEDPRDEELTAWDSKLTDPEDSADGEQARWEEDVFDATITRSPNSSIQREPSPHPVTASLACPASLSKINHDIRGNTLPIFMSYIEAGIPQVNLLTGVVSWFVPRCRKPPQIAIPNPHTDLPVRDIAFFPPEFNISPDVPAWRLIYWKRKAALEYNLDIDYKDFIDRMPNLTTTRPDSTDGKWTATHLKAFCNVLSMRIQRYSTKVGYLPLQEKERSEKGVFASNQALFAIENLSVLQGKLNTVWHVQPEASPVGPWTVTFPGFAEGNSSPDSLLSGLESTSYVVQTAYGLSGRVKRIADAIVFLDVLAFEAGWKIGRESRVKILGEERGKEDLEAWFEDWLRPSEKTPGVDVFRTALACARTPEERERVLAGDVEVVGSPSLALAKTAGDIEMQDACLQTALLGEGFVKAYDMIPALSTELDEWFTASSALRCDDSVDATTAPPTMAMELSGDDTTNILGVATHAEPLDTTNVATHAEPSDDLDFS